jgi:hypothetical protein
MAKKASKSAPKKRASRPVMSKTQTRLLEGAMAGGFAFVIGSVFLISSLQNFFMATNQFASVINSVLVDLTNTDRAAYNLGGLTVNQKLVEAAQAWYGLRHLLHTVRTKRWPITVLTVEAIRYGSIFMSSKRGNTPAAELVCKVDNTRCPVSDDCTARSAVS